MNDPAAKRLQINNEHHHGRLDVALSQLLSLSRSQARAILSRGQVLLNGRAMRESDKGRLLEPDDELAIIGETDPAAILPAIRTLGQSDPGGLAGAVRLATANPAQALGLTDRGEIAPGRRADLVVVDAADRVALTLCAGQVVFANGTLPGAAEALRTVA